MLRSVTLIRGTSCEDYVLLEGAGMPVEPGTRGVRQETTEGPVHVDRGRRGKP